jgi:diguanylate cyclase (GGDEF)-like protein
MDSRRRLIYLSGITIGFPAMILVWLAQRAADPFVAIAYPLLAGVVVVAGAMLLLRPGSLQRIEQATLLIVGVLFCSRMAFVLTGTPLDESAWERLGPLFYMNLVLLVVFANMVLLPLKALQASLLLVAVSTLTGLLRFVPEAAVIGNSGLVSLLRYEVYLLVISGFMYVLAKSKDDYFEAQLKADRMETAAYTDRLTGLPNRMMLDLELRRWLDVSDRHDRPLALIIFDLDRFKLVNDNHGHLVGDRVLQEVAEITLPLLRASDVLGRWGGEEFLIIAPETGPDQARALAERIRARFEQHCFAHGLSVTATFGVAAASGVESRAQLYERADALLYAAKRAGRNRVR